jgi:hypothetical protein
VNQVPGQRTEPTKAGGIAILLAMLVLSILAIPVFLVVAPLYFLYLGLLRLMVELLWVARGKRVLLIYSRSPVWQEHIESTWLPRLGDRAVILNWSDRKQWSSGSPFTALIFRHWAPPRNFNPGVILFPGFLRTKQLGFYDAFRDWKHGNEAPLRKAEMELFDFVDGTGGR